MPNQKPTTGMVLLFAFDVLQEAVEKIDDPELAGKMVVVMDFIKSTNEFQDMMRDAGEAV